MPSRPQRARQRGPSSGARDARGTERGPRSTAPPAETWNARTALALALVLLAALVLHVGALRAPFFADDYLFLDQARDRSLPATLTSPDPLGNYFRPVSRQLFFWAAAAISGESPAAFRAANLGLFLLAIALLFTIARPLLGNREALVAAALLALHHCADVPVLWACGSQDLLAVALGLGAIRLHRGGRRAWAAAALGLALLSKETVLLAPLAAVWVDRRRGEPWGATARRAWPLGATVVLWGTAWLLTLRHRPALGLDVRFDPAALPATLAHLAQTVFGAEWSQAGAWRLPHAPPVVPLALVIAALLLAGGGPAARASAPATGGGEAPPPAGRASRAGSRHALWAGLGWAAVAAIPIVAVAAIWSAYYYLFAMCGAALALAALGARWTRPWSLLLVALVAWGSENARRLPEFATGRGVWTPQSHLNRFYLERGMNAAQRYLADLRRGRPNLPPRSTLFFAGVPGQVAFQAGNGPLVRWAYRDSSLRSYFLGRFSLEQARRGPVFFFMVQDGVLQEITGPDSLHRIGFSLMVGDAVQPARDVLTLVVERDPADRAAQYARAWTQWALGKRDSARASLVRAGLTADPGPAVEIPRALAAVAAGDTAGASALMGSAVARHALDPDAHALLADLILSRDPSLEAGAIEAFAARVLVPERPLVWRRWGMVQVVHRRPEQAAASLQRYLESGGAEARRDADVAQLLAELRRRLPGGELVQAELRKLDPGAP